MSITDFLLARIAEDEDVARALVIPAHDGYKPHPELSSWQYGPLGEVEYAQTPEMRSHPHPDPLYVTCDGEGLYPSISQEVGTHIARHDPARVLRECQAKRQLVEEHALAEWDAGGRPVCQTCVDPDGWVAVKLPVELVFPCRTLRILASVYSDHPDYCEEWKP